MMLEMYNCLKERAIFIVGFPGTKSALNSLAPVS